MRPRKQVLVLIATLLAMHFSLAVHFSLAAHFCLAADFSMAGETLSMHKPIDNTADAKTTNRNEPDATPAFGKLQLIGGDVYRGEFSKNENPNGELTWRSPAFVSDLIVPWNAVDNILQAPPKQLRPGSASGDNFIIELQNGEALTGKVSNISEQSVDVDSELAGKKQIPLNSVRSILRAFPKTESDAGELKMADWKQLAPPMKKGGRGNWFDSAGSYDTETAGTVISQSINFPDLANIDINVAWQSNTPNWILQIGEPRKLEIHARKLENRNTLSVTMLVEDDTTADIATAQLPMDSSNALTLQVLCDSVRGRLVVMHNGNAIAQLRLNKSLRLTGRQSILFTNNVSGRLSLRSLKIYRSVFSSPVVPNQGKDVSETGNINSPETLLQNGQTYLGKPIGFDTSDSTFGFESTVETLGRVTLSQVDRIEFPPTAIPATQAATKKLYSVQLWSGERFVGQTISIQSNQLLISLDELKASVRLPLGEVMTIGQNGANKTEPAANEDSEELQLRFVSPWGVSFGRIIAMDASNAEQSGKPPFHTLNWKPSKALLPVALAAGVTGTIEPIATKGKIEKPKPKTNSEFGRTLEKDEPSLFLKSGDCFAAEIQGLQDGELFFKSSLFSAIKIEAALVRGVRKLAYSGTETMEKVSRKRLLTLPRSQRNNPPTHLVVSRDGDAIRGQLQSMDVDDITLQVRGEDRKIQMKNVAEIIWLLDAPEIVPPGKTASTDAGAGANDKNGVEQPALHGDLNCQALDTSGTRISIIPDQVAGSILHGQHPQLGPCQVDLSKISKLVLGDAIVADTKQNRFEKWRLENALDPKFVNDLDSPEAEGDAPNSAARSNLIDNAAPDFELNKLDGAPLKLSSLKGRIVVLDFWATWCGPCVASLPKITELGQEYKGANVDVIAVNIEENAAVVKSFLEKMKINPVVVLDADGTVAKSYQATAIPQTVIIDREGKVKHVFVGGGGATEAKIRESLDEMINIKL